ncbi:putative CBS-domain-containing membrane protein [uncultured Desulfatiglans sp.]|uniref:Putative CBS-domain-containing membrane protein n=1 Tax=Uncultured Desulfatiglans sp. TaxID=1748965 RepID=A0A653AB44_UNCDX|nr:putative CBS-domain-containing membrane protein [uncultured Desulfatiglans sp.]
MKVSEALQTIGNTSYLTVEEDCPLKEVARKIAGLEQVRGLYLVDPEGRLKGSVSLGALIRSIMAIRRPHSFTRTLSLITAESVSDIADKHVIYALEDDDIEEVLERMAAHNIKEIPVVDRERRIIGNVGILPLWNLVESAA